MNEKGSKFVAKRKLQSNIVENKFNFDEMDKDDNDIIFLS